MIKLVAKTPAAALTPFVRQLWKMEIRAEDVPYSHIYFPYGSFELIFYLDNPGVMNYLGSPNAYEQPRLCFSGQLTRPFLMTFTKPCVCMGVSLKPWVGNVVFDIPADEFTDKLVELADLVSDKLILSDNDDDEQHFSCLEQYLFQLLGDRRCDDMSAFLAQHICSSPVRQDVQSVINKIGLSKRRIEQRFLAATGLTIGAFTRKVRFQKAVTLLNNKDGERLTSIALNAGYYDQSHFISEFKYFAAVSPSAFQRQQSDLKDVLVRLTAAG